MRAVGFTEFGGPEVLHIVEVPAPRPGKGELLVAVRAAAVSPNDTLRRSGQRAEEMAADPTPYVVGMEFAGVLEAIGPNTRTDLEIGDRVIGVVRPLGRSGAYAEKVVAPVESVVKAPARASFAQASTLPMNGLTARMTLDELALEPGQTIAVTGAAGTYGGYVVQLAKAAGLRVIADASDTDRELVAALGADVIVPRGVDVARRIREVVPEGVDGLADGAVLNELVVDAVRDGGRIVTVRYYEGETSRGISWHPIKVRYYVKEHAKLEELRALADSGAVTLRVAGTYAAEDAAEAHRRLEAGGLRGRLVLTFD